MRALVATGRRAALDALQWCAGVSKATIEEGRKEGDRLAARLAKVRAEYEEQYRRYAEQERKRGNPDPKTHPDWPVYGEFLAARAACEHQDKVVAAEQSLLGEVRSACGELVGKLPAPEQRAVRDAWAKGPLAAKDWGARAEAWEIVGRTPTDWATEMLVGAAAAEPDPRVLVAVLDGLGGRPPAGVVPALAARLDDVRWIVRAAAVAALERTPARESVDALVARLAKEDGRLRDDCARALRALTGQDLPSRGEPWRVWWEANRSAWNGKPAAPDPAKPPDPFAAPPAPKPGADRRTGFFGLEVESKRIVYVIDVSGSMNEPVGGKGPDAALTRAAMAKRELTNALVALEDGALFDVVFFASDVRPWRKEMATSDAKSRREAQEFTEASQVVGATNTYDALETAFALGDMGKGRRREADPTGDARVDTIVLLSDGKPTAGRTTDPDAIRAAVREWNRSRRIALHTIAFGADADVAFLEGLASDSGGVFLSR